MWVPIAIPSLIWECAFQLPNRWNGPKLGNKMGAKKVVEVTPNLVFPRDCTQNCCERKRAGAAADASGGESGLEGSSVAVPPQRGRMGMGFHQHGAEHAANDKPNKSICT